MTTSDFSNGNTSSRQSTGTKIKMPSSHSQLPDNESVENLGVNLCVSSAYIQILGGLGVRTILIFRKGIVWERENYQICSVEFCQEDQ